MTLDFWPSSYHLPSDGITTYIAMYSSWSAETGPTILYMLSMYSIDWATSPTSPQDKVYCDCHFYLVFMDHQYFTTYEHLPDFHSITPVHFPTRHLLDSTIPLPVSHMFTSLKYISRMTMSLPWTNLIHSAHCYQSSPVLQLVSEFQLF